MRDSWMILARVSPAAFQGHSFVCMHDDDLSFVNEKCGRNRDGGTSSSLHGEQTLLFAALSQFVGELRFIHTYIHTWFITPEGSKTYNKADKNTIKHKEEHNTQKDKKVHETEL